MRQAWIVHAPDMAPVRCAIADISNEGARIVLPDKTPDVPDQFILLLTSKGEVRRACRVMWRTGKSVGLQFDESIRFPKWASKDVVEL